MLLSSGPVTDGNIGVDEDRGELAFIQSGRNEMAGVSTQAHSDLRARSCGLLHKEGATRITMACIRCSVSRAFTRQQIYRRYES